MVYTFMNLGAFAVITSLRQRDVIGDELDDLAGLYSRAPAEAALMLLFLLSLAGIPPAAGFLGKYYIFLSLIESGHYVLASVAVFYVLFGLYYYLKIANAMFMRQPMVKERLPVSWECAPPRHNCACDYVIEFIQNHSFAVRNRSLVRAQVSHVAAVIK
jgi:NADH-quinone oxidoreductase subunit N